MKTNLRAYSPVCVSKALPPLGGLAILAAFLWALNASDARAQIYQVWHRPPDVDYYQLESPNFRFIYQEGLEDEAREMAAILERRMPEVRAFVGLRRELKAPVVLNSFSDRSGGFVTTMPLRQEIEAPPLRSNGLSPRFASWFETVAPHELVHAAHAESGRGLGYGWLLRKIGPDLARTLNLSGPRGINEGAAVWYESSFRRGAGRLNHSIFRMEFRAAMLSKRPLNLTQMLEPSDYTRPFDRYYHGGGHLFEYMAAQGTLDFFPRSRTFYYRFPTLGYGPALWYGTRTFPYTLGRRLRRHFIKEGETFVQSLGELTEAEVVASERGAAYRRPKWVDDRTLVAYARGYDWRPGFYRVDAVTGRRELIAHHALTEDTYFSLSRDRGSVLFARYVPDALESLRWRSEVFRLNLGTGETRRLTEGGRAFAPVESPTGTTWVLQNTGQFNVWSEVGVDGSVDALLEPEESILRAIEPSPDGKTVAVLLRREGRQGIYRVRDGDPEPWIELQDASVYDLSWSGDGRYLLFTADPGGVTNVYAWDGLRDGILKITNVPFGAFEPALSPDGRTLAYVNYRHERYELVKIPFEPEKARVFPEQVMSSDAPSTAAQPPQVVETTRPTRYSGWKNLRPRVLYPFIIYQQSPSNDDDFDMGLGVGAGLEWTDPLQKWVAQSGVFYQKETLWGRLFLQAGNPLLRPGVEIYRRPSTVSVLMHDAGGGVDTVRVGRDERGAAIGVSLPVTLGSNVFQSRAFAGASLDYRQERLFDDAGETVREWEERITLRPSASLTYRTQRNSRDIVPNTGLVLSTVSRLDLWSEKDPSRWIQARSSVFLPFLHRSNTGIELSTTLHAQNRGGIIDLSYFFPRGYENNADYLGRGVFAKYGVEVTQPLWHIDNGFFLIPLYFRSLFVYGFAEALHQLSGTGDQEALTVAGAGIGMEMRFMYSFSFTLRFAPVYQFEANEWDWTLR